MYSINKNSATFSKHTSRGFWNLFIDALKPNSTINESSIANLTQGNNSAQIYGGDYDDAAFHRMHGWILWLTWGPLALIQFATTRYLKTFKYGIWVHIFTGVLNLIVTIVLGVLAIRENQWTINDNLHSRCGLLLIGMVALVNLTGVIMRLRILKRIGIYWVHKVLGYSILIIAQIQLVSGVLQYSDYFLDQQSPLGYIHVAFFGFLWGGLEVFHQFVLWSKRREMRKKGKVMSLFKFNQLISLGRQLVILEEKILDLESFLDNHPGGRNFLKINIGKDITKYFYGAFNFLNKNLTEQRVTHSLLGHQLAGQLAIGKLENSYPEEYPVQIVYISPLMGQNTKTFVFQGKYTRPGIQNFRYDIKLFGQYYIIFNKKRSMQQRQFYVCNCLIPEVYEKYKNLIKCYLKNKGKLDFEDIMIDDSPTNKTALTIQIGQNLTGLSNFINKQSGEQYVLKGPFGKGLELQYQGTHIAFTTGMGVLAYLDLIAHLLRKNLGLMDKDESSQLSFVDFKFILIVTIPKKKFIVGYELILGLVKINKHLNKDNFEFKIRTTDKQDSFWHPDIITKKLKKHDDIARIYVNGTPRMNRVFEDTLNKFVQKKIIHKTTFEIF
ncbi:cytochrome b5-like heme steroid binding domain containing protein [Stylonychia lemnae]|uniref:Cytochrome b5-like heme steroid binding domain containing protein n=1 Tax=Stylonychia lemnae TaxID=5949 RepID=A0A078AM18_STYLE|nr:cytochrome b5-like heme steroid binding domain containing protein [Stylonychia lemnae]|eukprot:CDW82462.1 cytochrome b5-like heme steroid binding domain containing protein [Stylonychia lemnae]